MTHWKLRFWSIFVGQALSQIGSAVTQFVILWWITVETKSIEALAMAGMFALLPQALFAPLGGVFADRHSRKAILIVTDTISALCIVYIILTSTDGKLNLNSLYALLFIRSSMQAFQGPASQASVENLVPRSFIPRAAGLSQSVLGIVSIASAPIAAFTLKFLPVHQALWIDVVTAALCVLSVALFRIPQTFNSEGRQSILKEFSEGFSFIAKRTSYLHLFLTIGFTLIICMPCFTLFTLLVTQHFNGTEDMAALFGGLAGGGMLLGGLLASVVRMKRKAWIFVVSWAVSCFTVSLTAWPGVDWLWIAVTFWFISGFTYTYGNAALMALIQMDVPNYIQGRVFSVLNFLMGLSAPIGMLVIAPIGESVGIRYIFLVAGIASGIICLIGLLSKPLMSLDKVTPAAK